MESLEDWRDTGLGSHPALLYQYNIVFVRKDQDSLGETGIPTSVLSGTTPRKIPDPLYWKIVSKLTPNMHP